MGPTKKKLFLIIISFIISFALVIALFFVGRKSKENFVCFESHCFQVAIALTPAEQEQGLMSKGSLGFDQGMLFVFEKEGDHLMWMKNTLIPLDIIFISGTKEIVSIVKNVQPCREDDCTFIKSDKKSQYVLEINAGAADKVGMSSGERIIFEDNARNIPGILYLVKAIFFW